MAAENNNSTIIEVIYERKGDKKRHCSHMLTCGPITFKLTVKPNDIVIRYNCCTIPVKVGEITKEDEKKGYKILSDAMHLECPFGCRIPKRKPKKLLHPRERGVVCFESGPKQKKPVFYMDSFQFSILDIPKTEGTFRITHLDASYLPPCDIADGFRAYVKINKDNNELCSIEAQRICRQENLSKPLKYRPMVYDHFPLTEQDIANGWGNYGDIDFHTIIFELSASSKEALELYNQIIFDHEQYQQQQ